jgi:hypothetical protein
MPRSYIVEPHGLEYRKRDEYAMYVPKLQRFDKLGFVKLQHVEGYKHGLYVLKLLRVNNFEHFKLRHFERYDHGRYVQLLHEIEKLGFDKL